MVDGAAVRQSQSGRTLVEMLVALSVLAMMTVAGAPTLDEARRAAALRLAAEGATVVIADIDLAGARETLALAGGRRHGHGRAQAGKGRNHATIRPLTSPRRAARGRRRSTSSDAN